jgi:guanine deaminase
LKRPTPGKAFSRFLATATVNFELFRMASDQQREFLLQAIRLSGERMREGAGGPFGAIIVMSGRIVAEGWNCVTSTNDPTAHAEVMAIRRACESLQTFSLAGCEIFSNCEPCPMCLAAIYWARLDRITFANSREDAAAIGFDDELIYADVSKPIEHRIIPTSKLALPEAAAVFAEWQAKANKVRY